MKIITQKELAEIIDITEENARLWARQHKIPTTRFGTRRGLTVFVVDEYGSDIPEKYREKYQDRILDYLTDAHQNRTIMQMRYLASKEKMSKSMRKGD